MSQPTTAQSPRPEVNNEKPRQSLDQRRASHAYLRIEDVSKELKPDQQDQYAGEAKRLPVRIMASGLGQALAFLHAKASKKQGHQRLLVDLKKWVITDRFESEDSGFAANPKESLLWNIVHGDVDFLRWATAETLAYLAWLNRFAEGKGLPTKLENSTDSV